MFGEMSEGGLLLLQKVTEMTGSLFATLLLIVLMLIIFCVVLRIPIEFSSIFVLPFLIVVTAYESAFLSVAGVFFIYVGLILANNFFFTRY